MFVNLGQRRPLRAQCRQSLCACDPDRALDSIRSLATEPDARCGPLPRSVGLGPRVDDGPQLGALRFHATAVIRDASTPTISNVSSIAGSDAGFYL